MLAGLILQQLVPAFGAERFKVVFIMPVPIPPLKATCFLINEMYDSNNSGWLNFGATRVVEYSKCTLR